MRRRILYVVPDLASARRMMDDLLLARIEERHIHFVGAPGTSMAGLHEANLLQTSDLVHGAQMGLVLGALLGTAVGVVVVFAYSQAGTLPLGTVLLGALLGGLFGAWVASMIGSSVPNTRLKPFQAALAEGKLVLMVDVPAHRCEEIRELLRSIHPEIEDRGLDPNVPAFP